MPELPPALSWPGALWGRTRSRVSVSMGPRGACVQALCVWGERGDVIVESVMAGPGSEGVWAKSDGTASGTGTTGGNSPMRLRGRVTLPKVIVGWNRSPTGQAWPREDEDGASSALESPVPRGSCAFLSLSTSL